VFAFGQTGSGKTYSIIGPNMAGMQGFDDSCADAAAASAQHGFDTPSAELDSGGPSTPKEPGSSGLADGHLTQQPQGAGSRCSSRLSGVQPPQQQLSEHEGLLARCVHQLYASIAQRRDLTQCSVTISCTEVYNEQVTDMLCKNKNQQLHVRRLAVLPGMHRSCFFSVSSRACQLVHTNFASSSSNLACAGFWAS
jgi:hypothetical protein